MHIYTATELEAHFKTFIFFTFLQTPLGPHLEHGERNRPKLRTQNIKRIRLAACYRALCTALPAPDMQNLPTKGGGLARGMPHLTRRPSRTSTRMLMAALNDFLILQPHGRQFWEL